MSDGGCKIRNKKEVHFLSFTVVEWVDVFTRKEYRDILLNSLQFCHESKGLLVHGWCVMSNHAHLLASSFADESPLRYFSSITLSPGTHRQIKPYTNGKKIT